MQDCFNCKIMYRHIYICIYRIYISRIFLKNFTFCKTINAQVSDLGMEWIKICTLVFVSHVSKHWIFFYHTVHKGRKDKATKRQNDNTGHTQKNGAVSIELTIETAPLFCVSPVFYVNFTMSTIQILL
jgi:hypothetical protein